MQPKAATGKRPRSTMQKQACLREHLYNRQGWEHRLIGFGLHHHKSRMVSPECTLRAFTDANQVNLSRECN